MVRVVALYRTKEDVATRHGENRVPSFVVVIRFAGMERRTVVKDANACVLANDRAIRVGVVFVFCDRSHAVARRKFQVILLNFYAGGYDRVILSGDFTVDRNVNPCPVRSFIK